MTVDLADLDRTTLNVVTGQSGHLLSPHYLDQWTAWYEGHTYVLPFSAAAVDKARAHYLTLEPDSNAGPR
jgi:penicillin amidase